jgi:hypothetical protein
VLKQARQPVPPGGAPAAGQQRRARPTSGSTTLAGGDAAARAIRPLLTEPSAAIVASKGQGFATTQQQQHADGAGSGLGGGTRPTFEWNPAASQAFGGDDDNEYEDLLGPIDADPPPPQAPPPRRIVGGMGTGGGGGGSLLQGTFDEDESAASFQEALRAFRGGEKGPPPASTTLSRGGGNFGGGGSDGSGASSGTGGGGGGSLLQGTFDEDESAASFQEALRAFRGEKPVVPVAAQRPSRFAMPKPAAGAAAGQPTLADKVLAIKAELGLPVELPMVEAVRAANGIVGLDSIGSLSDQLGRLLRETGIRPIPGAAAAQSGGSGGGEASGGGCNASHDEAVGGGARPPSRGGATQTQTQPSKSFYERLMEQKARDGVSAAKKGEKVELSATPSSPLVPDPSSLS